MTPIQAAEAVSLQFGITTEVLFGPDRSRTPADARKAYVLILMDRMGLSRGQVASLLNRARSSISQIHQAGHDLASISKPFASDLAGAIQRLETATTLAA